LRIEIIAMLISSVVLILLAVIFPAPIAPAMTDVTSLPTDSRAPWFFLWVQQMLKWGDPFFWGVLVPLIVLAVLSLIPYLLPAPASRELGRWFPRSNRVAQILLALISVGVILLTLLALPR
jgi:quinol-cytochrome oxidoreductase complex cytochrome b subunit